MTSSAHPPAVTPPARLRRQTSWLLAHASSRANRIVAQHLGEPGARMHYAILAGLDEFGIVGQAELCDRLGIDRGDAVAALEALEKAGYVRRSPDPRDGRRKMVEIDATGVDHLAAMDARLEGAQVAVVGALTRSQHTQLNALLTGLIEQSGDSRRG